MPPPPARTRARALGIEIGAMPTGPHNAITDVPGVLVGHATVWRDEPDPPAGRGVARTGVTVVVPGPAAAMIRRPRPAGVAVLNGAGELTSAVQVAELGLLETPIVLTSTMQVGRAWDGIVEVLCDLDPLLGIDHVVIPMVGECDDSSLNDARRVQIDTADVRAAFEAAAGGPVAEGAVGAGTGMVCFEWKGGIGTSSRTVGTMCRTGEATERSGGTAEHTSEATEHTSRTAEHTSRTAEHTGGTAEHTSRTAERTGGTAEHTGEAAERSGGTAEHTSEAMEGTVGTTVHTVGVLLLTNFGRKERLTVAGVPVGRSLPHPGEPKEDAGSCIGIVATDAPCNAAQLTRMARRVALGLARCGSTANHGSGEIFTAFSTVPIDELTPMPDDELNPLFEAVVDATEEAVLNSLFAADTVVGARGTTVPGLPIEATLALLPSLPG